MQGLAPRKVQAKTSVLAEARVLRNEEQANMLPCCHRPVRLRIRFRRQLLLFAAVPDAASRAASPDA